MWRGVTHRAAATASVSSNDRPNADGVSLELAAPARLAPISTLLSEENFPST
jgi:hypothetical protein